MRGNECAVPCSCLSLALSTLCTMQRWVKGSLLDYSFPSLIVLCTLLAPAVEG